jgi:hypothetical protein
MMVVVEVWGKGGWRGWREQKESHTNCATYRVSVVVETSVAVEHIGRKRGLIVRHLARRSQKQGG